MADGFYESGLSEDYDGPGPADGPEMELVRRLVREALMRHPGDVGRMARVLESVLKERAVAGRKLKPGSLADRVEEVLSALGPGILPPFDEDSGPMMVEGWEPPGDAEG